MSYDNVPVYIINEPNQIQFIVPRMNSITQLAITTGTNHRLGNSVFPLDIIINKYGKSMSHCLPFFTSCHWFLMSFSLAASLLEVKRRSRKPRNSVAATRSCVLWGDMALRSWWAFCCWSCLIISYFFRACKSLSLLKKSFFSRSLECWFFCVVCFSRTLGEFSLVVIVCSTVLCTNETGSPNERKAVFI